MIVDIIPGKRKRSRWLWPAGTLFLFVLLAAMACNLNQGTQKTDPLTAAERAWLKAHPVIRLAPDPNFPPVEYFDKDGEYRGITADYLALIEKKLGIHFEIVRLRNWEEIINKAKSRRIDAFVASTTPQRTEYLLFTKPFLEFPVVIIAREKVREPLSLEKLSGMRVSVVSEYAAHDFIAGNHPELRLDPLPDVRTGLRKVSFGLSDAFVENLATASYFIEKEGITNLRIAGESGYFYRMGFCSRKDWPELNRIFEKGLAGISPQEKEAIYKKWIPLEPASLFTSREFQTGLFVAFSVILVSVIGVIAWNRTLARQVMLRTVELENELAERRRMEEKLRFTQYAVDNSAAYAFWMTEDGRLFYVNDAACRALGYSRHELLRMSIPDIDPYYPSEAFAEHWRKLREFGSITHESYHRAKDGREYPVEIHDNLVIFDGKEYNCTFMTDISERKQAEEKLHRLNRELSAISNCNKILMRAEDEQTLLNDICRIICDEAGYRMAWVGYAINDEAKSVRPVAWAGVEDGYLANAEISWADTERGRGPTGASIRSGESVCFQDFSSDSNASLWRDSALARGYRSNIALPLKDENAHTFGSLTIYSTEPNAFTTDEKRLLGELAGDLAFGITVLRTRIERKRAENALRESEEKFRVLAETSPAAICLFQGEHNVYVNDSFSRLTGYAEQECREMKFWDWLHEDSRELARQRGLARQRREEVPSQYELKFVTKEGEVKWGVLSGGCIEYGGKAAGIVTIFDITERKLMEEDLQRARDDLEKRVEERTAELAETVRALQLSQFCIDKAAIGIYHTTPHGDILSANEFACQSLGYTADELLALKVPDIDPVITHGKALEIKKSLDSTGSVTHESIHRRKDGTTFPVEIITSTLEFQGKSYAFSFVKDITGRKRTENINMARLRLLQFAVTHSLDELLEATLDEAEALTDSLIGFYHFLEADQETLALQNWSSRTKAEFCKAEGKGTHYEVSAAGGWADCIRERRPIIHNDYASLPNRKGMPAGHAQVVRELVVPVFRGDNIVAILGVGNKNSDYTSEDMEAVSLLADLAWEIAERKKIEEELRLNAERMDALLRLNQMTGATLDEITGFAFETAVKVTRSRLGYLAFMNEDETVMTMQLWSREVMNECKVSGNPRIYPVEMTGLWGEAVRQRRPVITNDYAAANPWKERTPEGHVRITRHMNLPVIVGGKIVLVAGVGNKEEDYNEADVNQLTLLMEGMWRLIERKRAEEALREANLVVENSPVVLFRWKGDDEWPVELVSTNIIQFGYEPDEFLSGSITYSSIIHPDDLERVNREVHAFCDAGAEQFRLEYRIMTKRGDIHWVNEHTNVERGDAGGINSFEGIVIDVTERKQAEEALLSSEREKSLILNITDAHIIYYDLDMNVLWANKAAGESANIAPDELRKQRCWEVWHQRREPCIGCPVLLARYTGNPQEAEIRTPDQRIWFIRAYPVRNEAEQLIGMVEFTQDVTERKMASEELARQKHRLQELNNTLEKRVQEEVAKNREKDIILIQQNRQAALGEMLDHIAHQWKQPLNSIALIIQYAKEIAFDAELTGELVVDTADRIMALLDHMTQTIDTFRGFFRPDKKKSVFNMRNSIDQALAFIAPAFTSHSIAVELDVDPGLTAFGYQKEYAQVLLNILANTRDVFRARRTENPKVVIKGFTGDSTTVVTIMDNAGGIPEMIIGKIFDIYFTTNEAAGGTGIGLYMSKNIIEKNMGGTLSAENTEDGARFRIEIPSA